MGLLIGDLELGLGIWDWASKLDIGICKGIWIGDWGLGMGIEGDLGLGLGIRIGDWDW